MRFQRRLASYESTTNIWPGLRTHGRVPHYRDLTPADEHAFLNRHMNRVTDTCIPEMEAMRRIESVVLEEWVAADQKNQRFFPHEFMYKILRGGKLKGEYQIDPKNSWMLAATGLTWLGAVAPLGGLAFIAAWVVLAVAVLRATTSTGA
jgi:hypothetical protein